MTRRKFLKGSAALGAAATVGGGMLNELARPAAATESAELAAITGADSYLAATAAVAALGGMKQFVPRGSNVVINANTAFKHRGSIVCPEVLLATLAMCREAGAKRVTLLKAVPDGYWQRSPRSAEHQELIESTAAPAQDFKVLQIPGAVALKEAHVDRLYLESDVVINVSVAKHHRGSEFSGVLKNTMGACPHDPTCRFFHFGANPEAEGWYENVDHLSQCVADLNLVRAPELCLLDASEILTTNGPFGPGKLARPQTVVASADPVATDAYGVRFLDLEAQAVSMIARSQKHGLGRADITKLKLHEGSLS